VSLPPSATAAALSRAAARLQVLERRVRIAGRAKNEKALAQLSGGAASLAKATQHVHAARGCLDEAFEALRRSFGGQAAT